MYVFTQLYEKLSLNHQCCPFLSGPLTCTLSLFDVYLTLLHSERPKLCTILAFLSAIGLRMVIPHYSFIRQGFYPPKTISNSNLKRLTLFFIIFPKKKKATLYQISLDILGCFGEHITVELHWLEELSGLKPGRVAQSVGHLTCQRSWV